MPSTIEIPFVSPVYATESGYNLVFVSGWVRNAFDPIAPRYSTCGVAAQLECGHAALVAKTMSYRASANGRDANWVVAFHIPADFPGGPAKLAVQPTLFERVGPPPTYHRRSIQLPGTSKRSAAASISIEYPPEGERDAAEAEAFFATGYVTTSHTLTSATMNSYDAADSGTDSGVWYAIFPPLPISSGGVPIPYTLTVSDDSPDSLQRNYTFV